MDGREYLAIEQNAREAEPPGTTGTRGASGRPVQGGGDQQIRGSGSRWGGDDL